MSALENKEQDEYDMSLIELDRLKEENNDLAPSEPFQNINDTKIPETTNLLNTQRATFEEESDPNYRYKFTNYKLNEAYTTMVHTFDRDALERHFATDLEKGLSSHSAAKLLTEHGPNELTRTKHDSWWLKLLKCIFGGFFNILLWFASMLCFIAYCINPSDIRHPTDDTTGPYLYLGFVLAIVAFTTGIFVYYQKSKSADLIGALRYMLPRSVVTTRDGKKLELDPHDLVIGDVVDLTMGNMLPADIRIFDCTPNMEVDNSCLTGVYEPQKRDWKPSADIPLESYNLCFFGSLIYVGNCRGVVIATGDNTFMGRAAQLAISTEGKETNEIKDLVLNISSIAFVLGISFFIIGMVENPNLYANVVFLIGIIVANVPEGLLATVTVSLTLTARRMYDINVRVKNLEVVETLGLTSVICSGKTGTLTTNVMTTQHVYYDLKLRVCDTMNPMQALRGDFYRADDKTQRNPDFIKLIRCGALCNNAEFMDGEVDRCADAMEAAMVKFSSGHILDAYRIDVPKYRKEHRKLHEIPFNSKNKWQASVHELPVHNVLETEKKQCSDETTCLVQMKGAPERILNFCDRYLNNGHVYDLDSETRATICDSVINLGANGERILALAELILDPNIYDINVVEPQPSNSFWNRKDIEYDESLSGTDAIMVEYEDNLYKINLDSVMDEDNEPIEFENLYIKHLMEEIEAEPDLGIPAAMQRISFGDFECIEATKTFAEIDIKRGAKLSLQRGPYLFSGSNKEDANWPFMRGANEEGLVFIGLYAMMDPLRPGVSKAVQRCHSAGIKVIMITGDHTVVAKAIAKQVGIIPPQAQTANQVAQQKYNGDLSKVTADEYDTMVVAGHILQQQLDKEADSPQEVADFWNHVLNKDHVVFARSSPQQKLLIVSALQERGAIVAVTGDGLNDAPALKKADVGVAMGITGTDVAKEAADIILMDDNFASIVSCIEESRLLCDNLKKCVAYTLSSNIPEMAPFLLFQIAAIPLPLSTLTVMILFVDLGTDLLPALWMTYEGKESDIMQRAPRNHKIDKLASWRLISFAYLQIGVLQAIACFYAYFVVLHCYGFRPTHLWGLDRYLVFNDYLNEESLRDAYYLWCFDPEIEGDCYYLPNFYHGSVSSVDGFDTEIPYYTDEEFAKWQSNNKQYANLSKHYLIKKSGELGQQPSLTFDMLTNNDLLDWQQFDSIYWQSNPEAARYDEDFSLFYLFSSESFHSNVKKTVLFPSRRCESEDYSLYYREAVNAAGETVSVPNVSPPFCNVEDYDDKPRTFSYPDSLHSLFPMQTRTRAEALARSISAYFISIIIVQSSNLMICKTRVSLHFELGMMNARINYSLLFGTILGAFLVYVPIANTITGTRPLRFIWWTSAVPFSAAIYIYGEFRKGWIRKNRKGWIHRNTYW